MAKLIFEDVNPGIVRRKCPGLEKFQKKMENNYLFWWMTKLALKITVFYLDILKDSFLTLSILILNGGPPSLLEFPTKYTSVVFFCMMATIILPLTISSFFLARDNPELIIRKIAQSGWKRKLGQLAIMVLSFFNPALLIVEYETKKREMSTTYAF